MRLRSNPILFAVTYEIVTPESASEGDADERGTITEGSCLYDAIQDVNRTRTCKVDGVMAVEADVSPMRGQRVRWVTVINGTEFETGAEESRSLHIPESVTPASSRRIARLLGVTHS